MSEGRRNRPWQKESRRDGAEEKLYPAKADDIGRYEELGSGVRKVNLYLSHYAPGAGKPVFEDGDMFKVVVPLSAAVTAEAESAAGKQGTPQVTPQVVLVLAAAETPSTGAALQHAGGLRDRVHFLKAYLEPLLSADLIERTIPDKPRSRLQKYRLTNKGRAALKQARTEAGG